MDQIAEFVQTLGPDVVYVLLMLGVWLAITAIYIPGTGIPEVLALISLAAAGAGLVFLPGNLGGLILVLIGGGCVLAIIFYRKYWIPLLSSGLAFQIAGSVLLFKVGLRPDIWLLGLVFTVALAYHQIVLLPGLLIQNQEKKLDADMLVGMKAEVVATLDPVGTVRVHGELWSARADKVIAAGRQVRITERNGLQLIVTDLDQDR